MFSGTAIISSSGLFLSGVIESKQNHTNILDGLTVEVFRDGQLGLEREAEECFYAWISCSIVTVADVDDDDVI